MSNRQADANRFHRFGLAGLAWRMALGSPLRLAALFLLLAALSFILTGVELFQAGMGEAADRGAKRLGAEMMVVPAGAEIQVGRGLFGGAAVRLTLPQGVTELVTATPGVTSVAPQYFLFAAKSPCCDTGELLLVGFDPDKDFTVLPWLANARGYNGGDRSVLAGGSVRKGVGAELRIYNRLFSVDGRLEKSGLGYFDNAVFIPTAGLAAMERTSLQGGAIPFKLPRERPSILLVRLSPGTSPERTAGMLERELPGIRVLTMPQLFREKRDRVAQLAAWRVPLTVAAWLLATVAGCAAWLPWWRERRPLLGLLQVCGFARGAIVRLFAVEALLVSMAAMAIGGVLAWLLLDRAAPYLVTLLELPLRIDGSALYRATAPRLWLLFTGTMTLEAVCLYCLLLRREPAELVRRD